MTALVHYRAFGTPGGEYPAVCRAAVVTAVGGWRVISRVVTGSNDRRTRDTQEIWEPESVCSLAVLNPTGQFFNDCERDELPPDHRIVAGERTEYRGGTWHLPEYCRG